MDFSLVNVLILFFIFATLQPAWQKRSLENQRIQALREFERHRNSRLILLIHRQESINFFGIPVSRFISIEDSEQVLRAIRLTPPETPIDLILHTPGGLVLATEQIARALIRHPAKVTVFVPHYAMSGGTLLALASDEIVMDENAVLGPVDPQLGTLPAASILKVLDSKSRDRIDDQTFILADISEKAIRQVQKFVRTLLEDNIPVQKIDPDRIEGIIEALTTGQITHDCPITVEEATHLGLPITVGLPKAIYQLMELYPQPREGRPTVQYIPLPYQERSDLPNGKKNSSAR